MNKYIMHARKGKVDPMQQLQDCFCNCNEMPCLLIFFDKFYRHFYFKLFSSLGYQVHWVGPGHFQLHIFFKMIYKNTVASNSNQSIQLLELICFCLVYERQDCIGQKINPAKIIINLYKCRLGKNRLTSK